METPKTRRRLKVYFDGGCRPSPGRIEAAVVVCGVPHMFDDLVHGTNSDAEWLALICALELTQSLGLTDIELIGDAAEVIQQANRALGTGRARHRHAATFLALHSGAPMGGSVGSSASKISQASLWQPVTYDSGLAPCPIRPLSGFGRVSDLIATTSALMHEPAPREGRVG